MKHFSFLRFLTFLCFIVTSTTAWSQIKLGDNPKTISPYALLELSSTDQGLVIPRMTSAQRDAAFDQTAPVGTVIFNTDDNQLQYFFEVIDPVSRRVTRQWQSASNQVPTSANTTADELAQTASSGTLFYDEAAGELLVFDALTKTWSPVSSNVLGSDTVFAQDSITYTQPDGSTAEFNFSTAHQTLVVTPLDDNHQLGLALSDGNAVTLDLSGLNTDSQTLTTAFENNLLTTSISNGNSVSADLSALDDSGTDSQTLTTAFTNNILTTSISNGNSVSADLSALNNPGTDNQTLSATALDAKDVFTLSIRDGNTVSVNLSTLAGGSNTDSQTLAASALSANNTMTLAISDGNTVTLDLSSLDNSGSDSQTLAASALSANNTMTLTISDGNTVTLDLSSLDNSGTDSQTLAFGNSATTTQTTLTIAGGNALSLQATGALTFNQTTTNTLEMIVATVDTTRLVDADGDTQIQVEEGGNDNTIRFDTAGTERAVFTPDGDFIVGASQIDNQTGNADDARLIFDKSKGAFRAGTGSTNVWDGTKIGDKSIAAGYNSEASGERSVAFGNHTAAKSYAETAIGSYNTQVTPNATNAWNDTDRLFVIGNGASNSARSDALVMLKTGSTTLNGDFTVNGSINAGNFSVSSTTALLEGMTVYGKRHSFGASVPTNITAVDNSGWTTNALSASVETMGNIEFLNAKFDETIAWSPPSTLLELNSVNSTTKGIIIADPTCVIDGVKAAYWLYEVNDGKIKCLMLEFRLNNNTLQVRESNGRFKDATTSVPEANRTHAYFNDMANWTSSAGYRLSQVGLSHQPITSSIDAELVHADYNRGKVGIGTTCLPETFNVGGSGWFSQDLTVDGGALIKGDVNTNGDMMKNGAAYTHPDYVFEQYFEGASEANPAYAMPSLESVEAFVQANKHLPGVQSRAEIESKGHWNVSENVRTNLEKVEELYLHTIAQEKKINAQEKEIKSLKSALETLLQRMAALEKKQP